MVQQQALRPNVDAVFYRFFEQALAKGKIAVAIGAPLQVANGYVDPANIQDIGMRITDTTGLEVPSRTCGVDARVWPCAAQTALCSSRKGAVPLRGFGNFNGWWDGDDRPAADLLANNPEMFNGLEATIYVVEGTVGDELTGIVPQDWPDSWKQHPLRYQIVKPALLIGTVAVKAEDITIRQFLGDTTRGRNPSQGYAQVL